MATANTDPLPPAAPLDAAALNLYIAASAGHGLDPQAIAGAATTATNPSDAATNAQALTQVSITTQAVDTLNTQPQSQQAATWKQMSPATRQQFTDLGYTPPATHTGIWGDIAHIAGQGLHDVLSPLSTVANAAGAPLRAVQHVERAMSLVIGGPNEAVAAGLPDTGTNRAFSIADWTDAWNQTTNGEQFLDPVQKADAQKIFGPQIYNLAVQQATGKTEQEMLAPYANNQTQLTQISQLMNTAQYKKAVDYLNASHVSPGRALVGASFITAHPALGNLLSGTTDALFDWFTDPLMHAGVVFKAAKDIKYTANTPDDVQRLYDAYPTVRAAAQQMATEIQNPSRFLDRYGPQYAPLLTTLRASHATTGEDVLQAWKDNVGVMTILNGSPTSTALRSGGVLPHINPLAPNIGVKLQKAVNWAEEAPARALGLTRDDLALTSADLSPSEYHDVGGLAGFTRGMGTAFRRISTTVPIAKKVDLGSASSPVIIRQIAQMFLPAATVDKYLNDYLNAASIADRWSVYRSLMINLGEAANYGKNSDLWGTYLSKFAKDLGVQYDVAGNDIVKIGGVDSHDALFKYQLSNNVAIPDFRQAYLDANRTAIMHTLTGGVNKDWMDKSMGVWRGLTLAHGGFGFRVALEEVANLAFRANPISYMKGLAGAFLAKQAQRLAQDSLEAGTVAEPLDHTLEDTVDNARLSAWQRETSHLKQAVVNRIQTPADLLKAKILDQVYRASGKLAPSNMAYVIDDQIKSGRLDSGLANVLSSHGYDHTETIDPLNARTMMVKIGQKYVNAELARDGAFRDWAKTETLYDHVWYDQLANIAKDDWAREALPGAGIKGGPIYTDRVARVADKLEADPMWHDLSHRSKFDPQERSVKLDQITQREAAEDHARRIINGVDNLVVSPRTNRKITGLPEFQRYESSGEKYNKFLSNHLLQNGKPPSLAALAGVDIRDKPTVLSGPDLVPTVRVGAGTLKQGVDTATGKNVGVLTGGTTTHIIDRFFTKIVKPQIDWLSRQPQWFHFLSDSYKAYEPMAKVWRESGMDEEQVMNLVRDNATQRAMNQILPYVHNPELRSQMSVLTRNLAPFWFAQEQFYKRWGRVLIQSPAAFRKLQLMSGGIRHTGFIHTDPQTGQEYFVYPGSELVQKVLAGTLGKFLPGGTTSLPFGLTGQLNMLSPGLTNRIGAPSFGPMVVVPMNAIKNLDPHLSRAINDLEGPIAANSGYLKAIMPTTLERMLEFGFPSSINAATHASATLQAIAAQEAAGNGLGTPAVNQVANEQVANPKPGDYVLDGAAAYVYQPDGKWVLNDAHTEQTYLKRVQNSTRIILLTRLVYGFAAPASPQDQFNPSNLESDFQTLLNSMPPEEAITVYLAQHPDATPETIFKSANTLGGYLPSTGAAMSFLDANPKLVADHAQAAVYFIPAADETGNYSQAAYTEQMAEGLRQRKDPQTFYDDIVYQDSANLYFQAENYKNQLVATGAMPSAQITAQWEDFSKAFMAANPIFAAQYESTIPGALYQRQVIMQDVGAALRDPSTPKNAQSSAIAQVYQSYTQWQQLTTAPPGSPQPTSSEVLAVNEQYAQFLAGFVAANPGVAPLVDRAIRPDLTAAMDDLASQGQAVTF